MQVAMSDYVPDKNILRKVFLIFFFLLLSFSENVPNFTTSPRGAKGSRPKAKGGKNCEKTPST